MSGMHKNAGKRLLIGLAIAIAFTVAAMLILAVALITLDAEDKTISIINQFVKIAAILLGTIFAVPRGGERGLASGVFIAVVYTVLGYICYLALGGASFSFTGMLGEILIGTAVGAVCGAVRANLNPKRKHRTNNASA